MNDERTAYPKPSDDALDKRILDYILAVTSRDPWSESMPNVGIPYRSLFSDFRAMYAARRSMAQLYQDAKNDPFPLSSNIGVGIEQIFGERLIPTMLANTVDLEPMVQALGLDDRNDEMLAAFHDRYRRHELKIRFMHDRSTRELLTVGGVAHKWVYSRKWKTKAVDMPVYLDMNGQPIYLPDPSTGQQVPFLADPSKPEQPMDPQTGQPLKVGKLSSQKKWLDREGPRPLMRQMDCLRFPANAQDNDVDEWDWVSEDFEVSPWYFLGKEGESTAPFRNIDKLWKQIGLNPNTVYQKPLDTACHKVKLREFHGKYPAATDGSPIEIVATVAPQFNLLLDWKMTTLPRRPYFIRQVWNRGSHPLGRGIPETVWSLRASMDALVNQDLDSGNLYNHPPLLLSQFAMIDDEDYEQSGPGTRWIVSDINGAKFLPPPISSRNPIEMLNWIMGMTQRLWGVTDFIMNAPTSSLSPNIKTATGAAIVQSEGNVKFAHLVRHLAITDSMEMQFTHDLFRDMLKYPKRVVHQGQVQEVDRTFFREDMRIVARGDGLSTNPVIRQQSHMEFYQVMKDNPYIAEPTTLQQITQDLSEDYGMKIPLKTPQQIQQLQVLQELMQTPQGQAHMQMAVQEIQMANAKQNGAPNGRNRVAAQAPV